jgi:histone H3/H4
MANETSSNTQGGAQQAPMLLVASKVREALRSRGLKVGEGTLEALNGMAHWYLQQAALRAGHNGRKTVRPHDIIVMEGYDQ